MSLPFYILAVLLFANLCFVCGDNIPGNAPHVQPAKLVSSADIRRSLREVECYTCDNCGNVDGQTPRTYCPSSNDEKKDHKCVIFSELYSNVGVKSSWVTRGCAASKGSCEDIKRNYNSSSYNQLEFCNECEGDRCNSAGPLSEVGFAFFAVIVAPLLGKCILS